MSHRQPFLNIRTEGALLPSDLLSRLMEGTNLPGIKPEDYHLGAGEKLNEAVSRSWTRLLSLWAGFRKAKAALPSTDLGTTLTRERWLLQLFQELGYGRLIGASPFEIEEKSYPISHVWQGQYYQVPIHLVSFRADLDKRSELRIQGASKASPHGMVQEFLNRSENHLWAIVSNGLKLLILRDNASLTRQAYVEFDLESIFEGEAYADFRLLWLVCHQSRLEGTAKDRPETCWLELWSKQAQTDGRRALDDLRVGVKKALENLGTGFIAHRANQSLRDRLQAGDLQKQDFYRQLLRLVYRLIFLFVAEDRDLLHVPGASDEARSRYVRFYSCQRLRRMAEHTRGGRHADLWVGSRLVFSKLGNDGCPELGLPVLGGFLFGTGAIPDLESAELSNEHLLQAIRNLALVKDHSGLRLVDYRNLGSEELGSVYESLLELTPTMELAACVFNLDTVAGNQRKTSGSYYTPDSLVQCLLDSALDPVVEQAIKGKTPAEAEKAILALKVCDPAAGSGHFLVGAAHRLAKHLAQVRAEAQGESEPSPLYYQHALRDVIGHCLYGVDINPMAAELCRVSLWLEAIEPGKPLSFLDHHIRVGNSLLGATPALLSKGIPDEAFTPIEGDDKEICSRFKKVNKEEKTGQGRLFAATTDPWEQLGNLAASMVHLDDAPDDSIEAVRDKEQMYEAMVRSGNYLDGQFLADTWCAAFVWKKTQESNHPITEEDFRRIEHNPHACDTWMRDEIVRLSQQYQFFHWHLAFPDVFKVPADERVAENKQAGWNGGFDVVLGNPPWERLRMEETAFFASSSIDIAQANTSNRTRLIKALKASNSSLAREWEDYCRQTGGFSTLLRNTGLYPDTGRGKFNLAGVFVEGACSHIQKNGRVGILVPTAVATDEAASHLFNRLVSENRISSLYDFENSEGLFPDVDSRYRFCLLTAVASRRNERTFDALFAQKTVEITADRASHLSVSANDIAVVNPNSRTCPVVNEQRDFVLLSVCHRRHPVLIRHEPKKNLWGAKATFMFQMSDEKGEFCELSSIHIDSCMASASFDGVNLVRLYEAKLVHQFDHRFSTFLNQTKRECKAGNARELSFNEKSPDVLAISRFWIPEPVFRKRIATRPFQGNWLLSYREIARATDARTIMGAIIPFTASGRKLPQLYLKVDAKTTSCMLGALNSFCLDFVARCKLSGTSIGNFFLEQLPLPSPESYELTCQWSSSSEKLREWILPRVLELTFTAWDVEPFARDCGYSGPPFRWDEDRRFLLRCELDAAFFHLYLPSEENSDWRPSENEPTEELARLKASFPTPRDAVAHIMDTFPIVKRKDEAQWGEYRTKRVILKIYDAMAEAARTGIPYETRLSPPPADAAVAHPWPDELIQVAAISKDAFGGLAAMPDEALATPVGIAPDDVALFAMIDVVQTIGEAVDSERVRLAAILVRKPALATAFMDDSQTNEWLRVIGPSARPLRENVVQISLFQKDAEDYPWAAAFKQLKGSKALVVDTSGKWSAGDKMPASSGQEWITGRAHIAVQLLSSIAPAQVEQKLIAFNRSVEDGTARRAVS